MCGKGYFFCLANLQGLYGRLCEKVLPKIQAAENDILNSGKLVVLNAKSIFPLLPDCV